MTDKPLSPQTSEERANADSYVGIAPCGCIRAACVIIPGHEKYEAKFCADMVRRGLRLETRKVKECRVSLWSCERCEPSSVAKQEELSL